MLGRKNGGRFLGYLKITGYANTLAVPTKIKHFVFMVTTVIENIDHLLFFR